MLPLPSIAQALTAACNRYRYKQFGHVDHRDSSINNRPVALAGLTCLAAGPRWTW